MPPPQHNPPIVLSSEGDVPQPTTSVPTDPPNRPVLCPLKSTPPGRRTPRHRKCTKEMCRVQIKTLFEEYCERDPLDGSKLDVIGPDGILKFCKDLGVSPEDVRMLMIAFVMEAKKPGYFTEAEWTAGLTFLSSDSIAAIQRESYIFEILLSDDTIYDIFEFAYFYSLDNRKTLLNMETARQLLSLLLKNWKLYPEFDLFLKQYKCKVLNIDQWKMILVFSKEIRDREKISTYDPNDAWPIIFDEFVEWMKNSGAVGEPTTTNSDE